MQTALTRNMKNKKKLFIVISINLFFFFFLQIMVIVNRILGFPVTSPVSRFLTGLELLRDKIEEWNKNAHKGNNLIDVSLEVGQQIINWRKLEMAHWKECLNNLYHR